MPYKNIEDKRASCRAWARAHLENGRAKCARYRARYPELARQKTRDARVKEKGTWLQFYRYTWTNVNSRAVNGLHPGDPADPRYACYREKEIRVLFTREEFKAWCESRKTVIEEMYHRMAQTKKRSDGPSIDRIDSDRDYTLENIRILTLGENSRNPPKNKILSEEVISMVVALRAAGFSTLKISERMGMSQATTQTALRIHRSRASQT